MSYGWILIVPESSNALISDYFLCWDSYFFISTCFVFLIQVSIDSFWIDVDYSILIVMKDVLHIGLGILIAEQWQKGY